MRPLNFFNRFFKCKIVKCTELIVVFLVVCELSLPRGSRDVIFGEKKVSTYRDYREAKHGMVAKAK